MKLSFFYLGHKSDTHCLLPYILEASLKMTMYVQDVSIVNGSSWRVLMQALAMAIPG